MTSPLLRKMHRRAEDDVLLVQVPAGLTPALSETAASVTTANEHAHTNSPGTPQETFGAIHVFVRSQAEFTALLPRLRDLLTPNGRLWAAWPKGRRDGTDLTLPEVIRIAYDHRLVESTTIAVDSYWSAMKLTHPIPGKTYRNSYGTLPTAAGTPKA